MTIGVGSILFTGVQTFTNDADPGPATVRPDGFSFITTEPIPAGEVIRFTNADDTVTGTNVGFFDFTVGPAGLPALSVVAVSINLSGTDTPSLEVDASGGSVSANVSGSDFSLGPSSSIIASSGGEVIAAVGFGDDTWSENVGATGLSTTDIDAVILAGTTPQPVVDLGAPGADNYLYSGTTLEGIADPSNWVNSNGAATDHDDPVIGSTTYDTQDATVTCFAAGTRIAASSGEMPVETLRIGDLIRTADGRDVPVLWVGRQTVVTQFFRERARLVRVSAGTLGTHTDLHVTADHGLVIDGLVINAGALVGQPGIDYVPMSELDDAFTVYHVETEAHDVILANGAASETFIDYAGRQAFDNYAEYVELYGTDRIIPEMARPRISSARMLPGGLRARLDGQGVGTRAVA